MPNRSKRSGVQINATAQVTCPNCVVSMQLIQQLRALFEDERELRSAAEAKHQEERAGILSRMVDVLERLSTPPRALNENQPNSTTGRSPRPAAPRAGMAGMAHPVDIAARIANMRLVGSPPPPPMTIEEALNTPLAASRVDAGFEPPPDPAQELAVDEAVVNDVLGVATQGAAPITAVE